MTDEKKLQDEMLSDEQLDIVAGGYSNELYGDSLILYRIGIIDGMYDQDNAVASCKKIQEGWLKAGIICVIRDESENLYFLQSNGQQISSEQVLRYVAERFPIVR